MNRGSVWGIRDQRITEIIAEFCIEVVRNPLCYFSEADLQLLLAEKLQKYGPLRKWVPTQVPRGADSKGRHRTPLLHREYGGGEGRRIDIVILDPDEAQQIDSPHLTKKGEYVKLRYAFELGTEKTQNTEKHLAKDLQKLTQASKGYIIHFFKDITRAETNTGSRSRTEDKINRIFRSAFEHRDRQGFENIKILAILLRTGRDQPAMRGKCEIFDGSAWVKVNISRGDSLRTALMTQLR